MSSTTYLFWGYNVVWAILALYVLFLVLRLRKVGQRLDRLERGLRRSED